MILDSVKEIAVNRSSESESLDFLLVQISKLHRSRAHTLLEELGLYRGQPPMLRALWEQEGQTHGELADQLHVQPATITKMIQRMEKTGFVVRRSDPDDQRISRVYLTNAGRAIQKAVTQVWSTLEQESFDGFTLQECQLLRRFFLQIRDNLERAIGTDAKTTRQGVVDWNRDKN
jgi:DNA-binding MarR family transcriptional regulator